MDTITMLARGRMTTTRFFHWTAVCLMMVAVAHNMVPAAAGKGDMEMSKMMGMKRGMMMGMRKGMMMGMRKGMMMGMKMRMTKGDMGMSMKMDGMGMMMGSGKIIRSVLDAIGGEEAILALNQLTMKTAGSSWQIFEANLPEEAALTGTFDRDLTFDLNAHSIRVDTVFDPLFEVFAFFPNQTFTRVVQGEVGGTEAFLFVPPGTLASANVAALRRQLLLYNPHILLRRALLQNDPIGVMESDEVALVITDEVSDIYLFIDSETGFILRLETTESNPVVGDVEVIIKYDDWSVEATSRFLVRFPSLVELFVDGLLIWKETTSSVDIAPQLGDTTFEFPPGTDPDSFDPTGYEFGMQSHHNQEPFFHVGFSFPYGEGFGGVQELVANTIYVLLSFTNSVLIPYSGGAIVLEAPGSDIHGNQLFQLVDSLVDGASLTHLIQSNHQIDHSGGVREFVGLSGATLVVGHGIGRFWEKAFKAKSTIRPITVARNPVIEEIAEENGNIVIIEEDNLVVTVHHTVRDPYAEDSVIVVIETNGQLFIYESDFYNVGLAIQQAPEGFFDWMRDLNFIDENCMSDIPLTIIPAHGVPQSLEDSIVELASLGIDVGCP